MSERDQVEGDESVGSTAVGRDANISHVCEKVYSPVVVGETGSWAPATLHTSTACNRGSQQLATQRDAAEITGLNSSERRM